MVDFQIKTRIWSIVWVFVVLGGACTVHTDLSGKYFHCESTVDCINGQVCLPEHKICVEPDEDVAHLFAGDTVSTEVVSDASVDGGPGDVVVDAADQGETSSDVVSDATDVGDAVAQDSAADSSSDSSGDSSGDTTDTTGSDSGGSDVINPPECPTVEAATANCPAFCANGCADGLCLIACDQDDSCNEPIICPDSLVCEIHCNKKNTCNGVITAGACVPNLLVFCDNDDTCKNAIISLANNLTAVNCNDSKGCKGGFSLQCSGGAACDVFCNKNGTCDGPISCASRRCTVRCDGDNTCKKAIACSAEERCEVLCQQQGACNGPGSSITCQSQGEGCHITCNGMNSCNKYIQCNNSPVCNINCPKNNTCEGDIYCDNIADCQLSCFSTSGSCNEGTFHCLGESTCGLSWHTTGAHEKAFFCDYDNGATCTPVNCGSIGPIGNLCSNNGQQLGCCSPDWDGGCCWWHQPGE